MTALSLGEIVSAVKGELISSEEMNLESVWIDNISTDSRQTGQGDLFIPIRGENFDGHSFIERAMETGAVCALCERDYNASGEGHLLIRVEDTKKALRDLAGYYLSKFPVKKVAVTGSVGKTTTKDMIAAVLGQRYRVLKTSGNFNNEIGLPLTVFQLDESYEAVVLEMGMNSFGEIHNLSEIVRPDIAVITNVGISHVERLGSREGILRAKSEIFDFMDDKGLAVLNGDNDLLPTLKGSLPCRAIWFGVENREDIYSDHITPMGLEGTGCEIFTQKGSFYAAIPVPGEHMVYNAMCAAACGLALGLTLDEIKNGIENFVPTDMRMNIIKEENGFTIINDSYNANPVSMKAALDVLAMAEGHKTAVMGDMFELGENSEKMHYEIGEYADKKGIDTIICIGDAAQAIAHGALDGGHRNVFYYPDKEMFFEDGFDNISKSENTVLVKASHGMHLEEIIEKIQEVK